MISFFKFFDSVSSVISMLFNLTGWLGSNKINIIDGLVFFNIVIGLCAIIFFSSLVASTLIIHGYEVKKKKKCIGEVLHGEKKRNIFCLKMKVSVI